MWNPTTECLSENLFPKLYGLLVHYFVTAELFELEFYFAKSQCFVFNKVYIRQHVMPLYAVQKCFFFFE